MSYIYRVIFGWGCIIGGSIALINGHELPGYIVGGIGVLLVASSAIHRILKRKNKNPET